MAFNPEPLASRLYDLQMTTTSRENHDDNGDPNLYPPVHNPPPGAYERDQIMGFVVLGIMAFVVASICVCCLYYNGHWYKRRIIRSLNRKTLRVEDQPAVGMANSMLIYPPSAGSREDSTFSEDDPMSMHGPPSGVSSYHHNASGSASRRTSNASSCREAWKFRSQSEATGRFHEKPVIYVDHHRDDVRSSTIIENQEQPVKVEDPNPELWQTAVSLIVPPVTTSYHTTPSSACREKHTYLDTKTVTTTYDDKANRSHHHSTVKTQKCPMHFDTINTSRNSESAVVGSKSGVSSFSSINSLSRHLNETPGELATVQVQSPGGVVSPANPVETLQQTSPKEIFVTDIKDFHPADFGTWFTKDSPLSLNSPASVSRRSSASGGRPSPFKKRTSEEHQRQSYMATKMKRQHALMDNSSFADDSNSQTSASTSPSLKSRSNTKHPTVVEMTPARENNDGGDSSISTTRELNRNFMKSPTSSNASSSLDDAESLLANSLAKKNSVKK